MGAVERYTLRFGGNNPSPAPFASGIPGPDSVGSVGFCAQDALLFAGYNKKIPDVGVRIPLAKGLSQYGVTGIGIAADSAIGCCDISLGGDGGEKSKHRISPGNPLLGDLSEYDTALVTIPNPIPIIADQAATLNWDAQVIGNIPAIGGNGMGMPLRLEVYRGDVMPMRTQHRAPYHARAIFHFAVGVDSRTLTVCIDGRRDVLIELWSPALAGANVINVNIVTQAATPSNATSLIDQPADFALTGSAFPITALSSTVTRAIIDLAYGADTAGDPVRRWSRCPSSLLSITLSTPVGNLAAQTVYCKVTAYD
jgi:hypothetical protein